MPRPQKISIEKAKTNKLFYFVANVIVYRESDGRCLILKRDEREIAHPGKFGVIGGKLEWKDMPIESPDRANGDVLHYLDSIEKLLEREAKEEANIEIYPELTYINNVSFVRPDEVPVVMIKFCAKYKSGDVILEKGAFTDYAWVNADEVDGYDCIDGIKEEVKKAISVY
jgi:8-oxo-dGTP pyrophosphatase MutT (NUDIX family)